MLLGFREYICLPNTCVSAAGAAGNSLAEMPKPGRIENIADGGRQRAVIWELSGYKESKK